jgi:ElaB/YqjD/DUF883 family membrane-anchored ribosome-binding protein
LSACSTVGTITDSVKNTFDNASTQLQNAYDSLPQTVKDGFKSAGDFGQLTVDQIKQATPELLASAKSNILNGMTAEQLKGLGEKVQAMSAAQLKSFVGKLNKDTLNDSLAKLGEVQNWSRDQAKEFIDRVKQSDMYGPAETWTTEQVVGLKKLISGVSADDLANLKNDILSNAQVTSQLVAEQIGPIAQKTGSMTVANFEKYYNSLPPGELKKAVGVIGKGVKWGEGHMKVLYKKLSEDNFFGNMSTWSKETCLLLGDLLGPLVLEGKTSQLNKDAFKALGSQVVKAVILADTFKDAVWDTKVGVLSDIIVAVSGAFGPDAKQWTKETLAVAGPALIALNELSEIAGEVIMDAIPGIITNGFDWSTVRGMGKNFATRLKKSDAYGPVSTWTKDKVTKLGDALPFALEPNDIPQLDKEVLKQTLSVVKSAADKDGFDTIQLKALAAKLKEVYGKPTKDWTKEQIDQAGKMLQGLTVQDIKELSNDAVTAIKPHVVHCLDKAQLDALAAKLKQLSAEARNSVYGKKFSELSAQAKQALLNCASQCKEKFMDVVMKFKKLAKGVPKNLKPLLEKLVNGTKATVEKLPEFVDGFEVVVPIRITFDATVTQADIDKVAGKLTTHFKTAENNVVEDQFSLATELTVVDPNKQPTTEQGVSSAMTAIPTFLVATVTAFLFV